MAASPFVELRQYTLHGGRRDALIELFDRELVESQEALGVRVIGQFRDLDDPNRFVWLRGFEHFETRPGALSAFYAGPVWQTHRAAANATMIDSDNVLQLRPSGEAGRFDLTAARRGEDPGDRLIVASIHYLSEAVTHAFSAFFDEHVRPRIEAAGAPVIASFLTDPRPNNFPGLPVREGESAFVWFSRFADAAAHEAHRRRLAAGEDWREHAPPELLGAFMRRREVLRLAPTERSLLR